MAERDIEELATAQSREELSFGRLLRLYLDPFALFKSVVAGPPSSRAEALQYNRRLRRFLPVYVRRWALIAVASVAAMTPLGALARSEPVMWLPIAGLEISFSTALCMLFLCTAAYVVLGLDEPR
jgi:hypothetical protein